MWRSSALVVVLAAVFVRAGRLGALRVQVKGVVLDFEATLFGDQVLSALDFCVIKFFYPATVDTNQMVMMLAAVDLEYGFAGFEKVTLKQASLFELRQDAIHRGQTDIHVFCQKHPINIFCRHVPHGALFEQLKNFQTGKGGFQADALEALGVAHGGFSYLWAEAVYLMISGMIYRFHADMKCPEFRMRRSLPSLLIAASTLLVACSYKPSFINEYRIDVQQGNVLTQDMVAQLKPGQTQDQVRFILGSPLISDIFHKDRWDYVYHFRDGRSGMSESRRFSVFFDDQGRLQRVAGDIAPASVAELVAPVAKTRVIDLGTISPEAAAEKAPDVETPGFFRRMMNKVGL